MRNEAMDIYFHDTVHSPMRTDLCSCLGHLQNGCEAMTNSLVVLMPHEQTHGAFSILKQIGTGSCISWVVFLTRLASSSLSSGGQTPVEQLHLILISSG